MIGLPSLMWLPKPMGPGDMDGEGSKKVLGVGMTLPEILVRETAQNAWDARLEGQIPRFEMRYRTLDASVRDVLRWNVFRDAAPNLGLLEALAAPVLTAVEVLDRNTRGLGGPTRNDIERHPGDANDYADFVLTVGAPPDQKAGGGTYGFGKTASYLASSCSTIVIWSRSRDREGQFVERFIASAMGPSFILDDQRYTGRQWWGLGSDGSQFLVEPATDADARRLGEAIFEVPFKDGETGTSILILQPKESEPGEQPKESELGDEEDDPAANPAGLVGQWAAAIADYLWPKFDPSQEARWRVDTALFRDGIEIPLASASTSAILAAKQACLEAVREAQAGRGPSRSLLSVVQEITWGKQGRLLGHVAFQRVFGVSENDRMFPTLDTVTYMRHDAELVVQAQGFGRTSDGLSRWVGVFKPTQDVDEYFAQAEPPLHDSWKFERLDSPGRSFVRTALRKIKEQAQEFLKPKSVATATGEAAPTGALSAALAGLIGSAGGTGEATRDPAPTPRARTRKMNPKLDIVHVEPLPQTTEEIARGRQRTRVAMKIKDATEALVRPTRLAVAIDGNSIKAEEVRVDAWQVGGIPVEGTQVRATGGQEFYADLSYPAGIAIEFDFAATEA